MVPELVLSIAECMVHEKLIQPDGLELLYTIQCDPYHEYLYYSITLQMTELYGEWVEKTQQDKTNYKELQKNAVQMYIRLYTVKQKLSVEELKACHVIKREVFRPYLNMIPMEIDMDHNPESNQESI